MRKTKPLAEESFILPSGEIGRNLNKLIFAGRVALTPVRQPGLLLLLNWEFCQIAREPKIRVWYQFQGESKTYSVGLKPSDIFGGRRIRWRFDCVGCNEQADKLYLPIRVGQRCYFLCRLCWGIEYGSHVYPRVASRHTIEVLDQKIRRVEAELFKLKSRRNRVEQSLRVA